MKRRDGASRKVSGVDRRLAMSPMFVVGVVAVGAMVLLLGGGYIRRALVERLDPRISVENDTPGNGREGKRAKNEVTSGAIFDGEVYRTEGRLRETGALAIAVSLYGVGRIAEHRPVRTVEELLAGISTRGLMPPGLQLVPNEAAVASEYGTLYVRYRPQPFAVEVLSMPRERMDGPSLLMRVPDVEESNNSAERVRYFQSHRLDGVRVPPPFALASEIQSLGWSVEKMRASQPNDVDAQRLAAWVREQTTGNR